MSITPDEAKAILSPYVKEMMDAIKAGDMEKMSELYDKDAVSIHSGFKCNYGKEEILKGLKQFTKSCGDYESKILDERYEGTGDYIIYTAESVCSTQERGDLKAGFFHIWKKFGDKYFLIHDQFTPLP